VVHLIRRLFLKSAKFMREFMNSFIQAMLRQVCECLGQIFVQYCRSLVHIFKFFGESVRSVLDVSRHFVV
jgi:hypothetical protein